MKRLLLILLCLVALPTRAFAEVVSPEDQSAVKGDSVYYDTNDYSGDTGSFCGGGGAALSSQVPEPYHAIFANAAAKFNTDPALLATIFLLESGGGNWRTPPAPYGNGVAWSTRREPRFDGNPAYTYPDGFVGSKGPFQFLQPTWEGSKQDGNGDGVKDVEDLTDAAYAAARLISEYGGKVGVPFGDPDNPKQKPSVVNVLGSYNGGPGFSPGSVANYIKVGTRYYQQLSSRATDTANQPVNSCGDLITGNSLVDIALSQVGTGPGGGYLKYSDGRHENWCADFVSWVFQQASKPLTPPNIPAAASVRDWFKANGVWVDNNSGLESRRSHGPAQSVITLVLLIAFTDSINNLISVD